MKKLRPEDLKKVNGGAFNFALVALIAAGVTFVIGVFDGYTRKLACH